MDATEHDDTPECHRKTAWTKGICGHPEAMGGRTLDCVGGTQSLGAANNYSPQQPQPRIKRSLSLSWFYCNAPESDLSEVLVFDRALTPRRRPAHPTAVAASPQRRRRYATTNGASNRCNSVIQAGARIAAHMLLQQFTNTLETEA